MGRGQVGFGYPNFGRFILGCIEADFRNRRLMLQHLSFRKSPVNVPESSKGSRVQGELTVDALVSNRPSRAFMRCARGRRGECDGGAVVFRVHDPREPLLLLLI